MRSIRCCLFRAGITRDPGPHLGDRGAVEGGDGATGAPPPPPRPDTDPGPGCRRDQGARAALPPAEPRDQGAERQPALPWGGVEVPPPGHQVQTGKGTSEHGLLQRSQEDRASALKPRGGSRLQARAPASLRAPEGAGSSTRGRSGTEPNRVLPPLRRTEPKETRAGRRQERLS